MFYCVNNNSILIVCRVEDKKSRHPIANGGSMFCDMGLVVDPRTKRLLVVSAIDNICRGASGQALANANLMSGLDVAEGLDHAPMLP